jgi:xanthine dehydrogenase accessory factor
MGMKVWVKAVCDSLAQKKDVVVATVLRQEGSTPRGCGTRMVVSGNRMTGTVGGGWPEASVLQAAGDMMGKPLARILSFDLTATVADGMDMICGGRMDILIESILPTEKEQDFFQRLTDMLQHRKSGCLLTEIRKSEAGLCRIERNLTEAEQLNSSTIISGCTKYGHLPTVAGGSGTFLLTEPIAPEETVYLFGAGHVSRETAMLASRIGFETVVLDDRPEFANRERFPEADEIHVLPSFEQAMDNLVIDSRGYIVILTRGHLHDKTVLGQAVKTPARYVGMIGSRKKRDAIFRALAAEGIAEKVLARVHSPIGISIDAETPAEIAVSIAAELIRVRRQP